MAGFHAEGLEVIVDHSPEDWCPDRGHSDKRLARDVLRTNEIRAAKAWLRGITAINPGPFAIA